MTDSNIIIETSRLYVRKWQEKDLDKINDILGDPEMQKYVDERPWSLEAFQGLIQWNEDNFKNNSGYFNCPVILKENDELIGRVGLNPYFKDKGIPEIEWTIGKKHWNKGYASEVAKAVIGHAFSNGYFNVIISMCESDNLASQKVMLKCSMGRYETKEIDGKECSFYVIYKD